jgi:hypothetical protein
MAARGLPRTETDGNNYSGEVHERKETMGKAVLFLSLSVVLCLVSPRRPAPRGMARTGSRAGRNVLPRAVQTADFTLPDQTGAASGWDRPGKWWCSPSSHPLHRYLSVHRRQMRNALSLLGPDAARAVLVAVTTIGARHNRNRRSLQQSRGLYGSWHCYGPGAAVRKVG